MNLRVEFDVVGEDREMLESEARRILGELDESARHWRIQMTAKPKRTQDGDIILWEADVTAFCETTGSATPR